MKRGAETAFSRSPGPIGTSPSDGAVVDLLDSDDDILEVTAAPALRQAASAPGQTVRAGPPALDRAASNPPAGSPGPSNGAPVVDTVMDLTYDDGFDAGEGIIEARPHSPRRPVTENKSHPRAGDSNGSNGINGNGSNGTNGVSGNLNGNGATGANVDLQGLPAIVPLSLITAMRGRRRTALIQLNTILQEKSEADRDRAVSLISHILNSRREASEHQKGYLRRQNELRRHAAEADINNLRECYDMMGRLQEWIWQFFYRTCEWKFEDLAEYDLKLRAQMQDQKEVILERDRVYNINKLNKQRLEAEQRSEQRNGERSLRREHREAARRAQMQLQERRLEEERLRIPEHLRIDNQIRRTGQVNDLELAYPRVITPPPVQPSYGAHGQGDLRGDPLPWASRPPEVEVNIEEDYDALVDEIHRDVVPMDIPKELNVVEMEHQRLGLGWLVKSERGGNKGGILADEMGLGKTVQSISLIYANRPEPDARRTVSQPHLTLIVCPLALIDTWKSELENRVHPEHRLKVYVHHTSVTPKLKTRASMIAKHYDVVIVPFDKLMHEHKQHLATQGRSCAPLFDLHFFRVILDEAHSIKNLESKRAQACHQLKARYRLCLSGTPMQNNLKELYSLLRFLRIKPFWDRPELYYRMLPKMTPTTNDDGESREVTMSADSLARLRALLAAVMLRRRKDTIINGRRVIDNLPSKTLTNVFVKMHGDEQERYVDLESRTASRAERMLNEDASAMSVLLLLLRLRQKACHPLLQLATRQSKKFQAQKIPINDLENALRYPDSARSTALEDPPENRVCTLCYDELAEDTALALYPCGHLVCKECREQMDAIADSQMVPPMCNRCNAHVGPGGASLAVLQLIEDHPGVDVEELEQLVKQANTNFRAKFRVLRAENRRRVAELRRAHQDMDFGGLDSSDESDLFESGFEAEDTPVSDVKPEPDSETPVAETDVDVGVDVDVKVDVDAKGDVDADAEIKPEEDEAELGAEDDARLDAEDDIKPDAEGDIKPDVKDDESKPELGQAEQAESGADTEGEKPLVYKHDIDKFAQLFIVPGVFKDKWVPAAKVDSCIRLLQEIWETHPDDKVIVFSQFVGMLDIVSVPFNAAGIDYLEYHGGMAPAERVEALQKFGSGRPKVLLTSLKAGNVGLTLTAANRVIILDPFWNPYVEHQAEDRVHRIGQTKPVHVYRMYVSGTVEDRIRQLQERKRELIESALSSEGAAQTTSLSRSELRFMFGLGNETATERAGRSQPRRDGPLIGHPGVPGASGPGAPLGRLDAYAQALRSQSFEAGP